jgi:hypothetical protein
VSFLSTSASVVGIGRVETLVGWGVIAAAFGTLITVATLSHGRFPGGVALLRAGMRNRLARSWCSRAGCGWVGTSSFGPRADASFYFLAKPPSSERYRTSKVTLYCVSETLVMVRLSTQGDGLAIPLCVPTRRRRRWAAACI